MKKTIYLVGILTLLTVSNVFAQLNLPRESQRQEIAQTIGDTRISLVYHRPNVKAREVWGKMVPLGEVWRTGANENVTFETNRDVKINGQTLPAGKYGLHTIPNKDEWTIIFNKVNNEWGSFKYDVKQDQLRVSAKPLKAEFHETMALTFENVKPTTADVAVVWENLRVPFTVDVGDVNARILPEIRKQMSNLKADDLRTPVQAANWIYTQKMTANYAEAIGWLDASLKTKETPNALGVKAYLLADSGKKTEAITAAERAIQLAKAMTPAGNTTELEKRLAEWKGRK
ncbi:MAG TPA: DUF2911 domain-containing protein [Pyrinomonadaceae bacterium]|nr:DUF2911 domain-containing protein [Pyrinomonadaceae bacterium]